jgi:SulP family sulfate permease
LLPLLAFATFGSSRYLVVAADSATAAILAGGISGMAPGQREVCGTGGNRWRCSPRGFCWWRGCSSSAFIADFLSQTVLVGFLTGVGFQVGIAVLGEMLGLEVHSRRTVVQLAQVSAVCLTCICRRWALSAVVVAGVLTSRRFAPRIPAR